MLVFHTKRMVVAASIIVLILLTPLIAMQFTNEVNWTVTDFIVAAVILTMTALLIELSIQLVDRIRTRGWLITAVVLLTLYIWVELAVGIIS